MVLTLRPLIVEIIKRQEEHKSHAMIFNKASTLLLWSPTAISHRYYMDTCPLFLSNPITHNPMQIITLFIIEKTVAQQVAATGCSFKSSGGFGRRFNRNLTSCRDLWNHARPGLLPWSWLLSCIQTFFLSLFFFNFFMLFQNSVLNFYLDQHWPLKENERNGTL